MPEHHHDGTEQPHAEGTAHDHTNHNHRELLDCKTGKPLEPGNSVKRLSIFPAKAASFATVEVQPVPPAVTPPVVAPPQQQTPKQEEQAPRSEDQEPTSEAQPAHTKPETSQSQPAKPETSQSQPAAQSSAAARDHSEAPVPNTAANNSDTEAANTAEQGSTEVTTSETTDEVAAQ